MKLVKSECGLGDLFENIVNRYGNSRAIYFSEKESYTYTEFNNGVNKIVNFLNGKGVTKGSIICINLEKSFASYCLIIASLKMGLPYFFLDPNSPISRTKAILQKTKPTVTFTSTTNKFIFKDLNTLIVEVNGSSLEFCNKVSINKYQINFIGGVDDVAYIMFTSGSTGVPKGAKISHDNLRNFIEWAVSNYDFTVGQKHSHLNPIFFDNSVFDIYSTFFSGGDLIVFSSDIMKDPTEIVKKIDAVGCNILFSVPSMFIYLETSGAVTSENFTNVKKIIFGGEGYPKTQLLKLYKNLGHRINFYNVYGPTECTCICSSQKIDESEFNELQGYPKIGKLSNKFNGLLIGEDGLEVETGKVGELYLGGSCVGLGYVEDIELTNKNFLNLRNKGEIFYRTGDLFIQDKLKELWFVGRYDFQVKHQGYRIELEEIEHAILMLDNVNQAIVIQVKIGDIGSLLIAFVSTLSEQEHNSKALKENLSRYIPKYMLPNKIIFLKVLPKNSNGKIDRNELRRMANKKYGGSIE